MEEFFENLDLKELNNVSASLRIVMSIMIGGILGIERTKKGRPAGMRTYMLVCLGSCLVIMTGIVLSAQYGPGFDPARMAAQVISGVGFLGAGTIMNHNRHVKGLTTAAGLWVSACLGLVIGIGWYVGAIVASIAVIFTMIFANKIEQAYILGSRRMRAMVILSDAKHLPSLIAYLRYEGINVTDITTYNNPENQGLELYLTLTPYEKMGHEDILSLIRKAEGVLMAEKDEN